jgi:hypothetical protein
MILLKVAREGHTHKRDNVVDIAGYAELVEAVQPVGVPPLSGTWGSTIVKDGVFTRPVDSPWTPTTVEARTQTGGSATTRRCPPQLRVTRSHSRTTPCADLRGGKPWGAQPTHAVPVLSPSTARRGGNGCAGCTRRWDSVTQAHCAGCHSHFTTVAAFDKHRDKTFMCLRPESVQVSKRPEFTLVVRPTGTIWQLWRGPQAATPARSDKDAEVV